jgi:hypothetical protein
MAGGVLVLLFVTIIAFLSLMQLFDRQNMLDVRLDAPCETLQGEAWELGSDGRPIGMLASEGPRPIVIHFTSGRTYTSVARNIVIWQHFGTVDQVGFVPHKNLLDYQTALTQMEEILRYLQANFQTVGYEKAMAEVRSWKEKKLSYSESCGVDQPEDGFSLFIEIKPYKAVLEDPREWYIVLTFTPYRENR